MSGVYVRGKSRLTRRALTGCVVALALLSALMPAPTVAIVLAATASYTPTPTFTYTPTSTVTYTPSLSPTPALTGTPTPTGSPSAGTYVVVRGDTLFSIARRYGMTVEELRRINHLPNDVIYVGQVLRVGGSAGAPTAAAGTTHTVVRGDTLYSIARRYGTTVDALMRANRLAGTNIYVGQRLVIPGTSGSPSTPTGQTVYTVVQGDTLYSIARRYGTSVNAIVAANRLSGTAIYTGQRLVIPVTGSQGTMTVTPTGTVTPSTTGTPTFTPTFTPTPTLTPTPTPTGTPTGVVIQDIFYDGEVQDTESDEYVAITNYGLVSQNLAGWHLYADDKKQCFPFPNFELTSDKTCFVYTNEIHDDTCEFSFGYGQAIWNNDDGDCGYLFNAENVEVDWYCYGGKQPRTIVVTDVCP